MSWATTWASRTGLVVGQEGLQTTRCFRTSAE